MKPNGKMFAVRVVLFVVCAVGLFSTVAEAGTVRGTFYLPVAAHWGTMVLSPGEYEFVVDTGSVRDFSMEVPLPTSCPPTCPSRR